MNRIVDDKVIYQLTKIYDGKKNTVVNWILVRRFKKFDRI